MLCIRSLGLNHLLLVKCVPSQLSDLGKRCLEHQLVFYFPLPFHSRPVTLYPLTLNPYTMQCQQLLEDKKEIKIQGKWHLDRMCILCTAEFFFHNLLLVPEEKRASVCVSREVLNMCRPWCCYAFFKQNFNDRIILDLYKNYKDTAAFPSIHTYFPHY